jgi:hypothetical protein
MSVTKRRRLHEVAANAELFGNGLNHWLVGRVAPVLARD